MTKQLRTMALCHAISYLTLEIGESLIDYKKIEKTGLALKLETMTIVNVMHELTDETLRDLTRIAEKLADFLNSHDLADNNINDVITGILELRERN